MVELAENLVDVLSVCLFINLGDILEDAGEPGEMIV